MTTLFYAYSFFARVAPSVMIDDLMRDFGVGAAVVGNLSAFFFYAYAGMQLPAGVTLDRLGPRRTIALAAAVCGVGSFLFANATGLSAAYAGRFLIGAGSAFAFIGTLKLASIWYPPRRFASIFGIVAGIGAAGAVVGQGPLAALVAVWDWRTILNGGGALACALAIAIWLLVRDGAAAGAGPTRHRPLEGLRVVARNPQTWLAAVQNATVVAPLLVFGALWGVPYLTVAYGLDRPTAGFGASLMLVGHAVAVPFYGWASDRMGLRKPFMIGGAVLAFVSFSSLVAFPGASPWLAYALLLAYGIASGATCIGYTIAKESNPLAHTGVATGFVNMMTMGTTAILQYVLGLLLDHLWDGTLHGGARVYSLEAYRTAMIALVVAGVLSMVVASLVRETRCRGLETRGEAQD